MKKWLVVFVLSVSCFLHARDDSWDRYKRKTLKNQDKVMGWCSHEKAEKLMDLIYATNSQLCVEIGVFGGASIYPTAKALKYSKTGVVYAIDPWSAEASSEGYSSDNANYVWWNMLDYEEIYQHFLGILSKYKLNDYCRVLRMTSIDAVSYFQDESIDILHVDGNHCEESAYRDVVNYFPKVKPGGHIWFDDANWGSTNKAMLYLCEHAFLESDYSVAAKGTECLLFKKPEISIGN